MSGTEFAVAIEVVSTAEVYWLAVDERRIPVIDGRGSVRLTVGRHVLVWWMEGERGTGIDLALAAGDEVLATVSARIASGYRSGAGVLHFDLD
jgi:hypothetical protein